MKHFKYTGSQDHNSTIHVEVDGKKVKQDVRLSNGDVKELPEDHDVIKALIRRGLLQETKFLTSKK